MKQKCTISQHRDMTRRDFLERAALAGVGLIPAVRVRGASGQRNSPSQRLNIAGIGLGVRGLGNVQKCEGENIVALCDVDWDQCATAFQAFPQAAKYRDFRHMLDRHPHIDAVVISTPDHTHAVIAAEAMKRGKHVYVEAPLAHDVGEVRALARLARETGVTTQMGNERHSGAGIRKAVEMIRGGGLGPIREVHCWTNRPQWPQGIDRPQPSSAPSPGLNWDLWLGPAPARDYHPAYHPYRWRGWLDFGTGALGAMGCHLLDVVFWGLELNRADTCTVIAESTGMNRETYPRASTVQYRFPPRGDLPPVRVTWYDGGRQPQTPEALPYLRELGSNGSLFVGDQHSMIFGPTVFGTNPGQVGPRVLPEFTRITPVRRVKTIPRVKETAWIKGDRHLREWINACKAGTQPCADFAYSAGLTEMVLLGNIALHSTQPITWDKRTMGISGMSGGDRLVHRAYRKGWSL